MTNHDHLLSRRNFLQTAGAIAAGTTIVGETTAEESAAVKPKIKIGQIGTAHMHAYKFGTLRKLPDLFEVVGFTGDDPNDNKQGNVGGIYKDLRKMTWDELLAVPGLQAVGIETEEHGVLRAALRAVQAGKHIHLDKPAGESLPEFKQILDLAKEKNLVVQMGYMYRNNPAIQFCLKAVNDGLIGDIYDIDAAMCRFDAGKARDVFKPFKGGSPFIFACHLIDIVVSLLGKPEKIHPFNRRTKDDGIIDNSLTVFEYPKNKIATVRTSINEVEGFQHRYLTVRGSKGVITVRPLEIGGNLSGGKLLLSLLADSGKFKKGEHIIPLPAGKDRYEAQWIEFAKTIDGEMVNPYTYEHDYIVQEALLEACEMNK